MRVWLNDYEINNPSNRVYLDEPIEGLELPLIRTSKGTNTGQHGGYVGPQLYGARPVTLPGHIFADTVAEGRQKRRDIQAHLPLRPAIINVRVLDDDGMAYTFNAYLIDFQMPLTRSRFKHIFKIELEADDPIIYDDAAGSALQAAVNQVVPGGFQFTDTSPQFDTFYFSEGSASTTVTNTSEVTSQPLITIIGKTTNPVFTNRTTSQTFRLANYSVDSTSATVIDLAKRTVKLGLASDLDANGDFPTGKGGGVFAYVPNDVEWWGLVPGDNLIEFTSGSGGDVTTATMRWRPGYWGI